MAIANIRLLIVIRCSRLLTDRAKSAIDNRKSAMMGTFHGHVRVRADPSKRRVAGSKLICESSPGGPPMTSRRHSSISAKEKLLDIEGDHEHENAKAFGRDY